MIKIMWWMDSNDVANCNLQISPHDFDLVDSNHQDIQTCTCNTILERPMHMFANDSLGTIDSFFMLDEVATSWIPLRLEGEVVVSVETTQPGMRYHVSPSIIWRFCFRYRGRCSSFREALTIECWLVNPRWQVWSPWLEIWNWKFF